MSDTTTTTERTGQDRRRELIDQVEQFICSDRQNHYGDAEDNFADIAAIANVVLKHKLQAPLNARDVAAFSACIKLARIRTSPDLIDHWLDLAGYAICGGGIVVANEEKESA